MIYVFEYSFHPIVIMVSQWFTKDVYNSRNENRRRRVSPDFKID